SWQRNASRHLHRSRRGYLSQALLSRGDRPLSAGAIRPIQPPDFGRRAKTVKVAQKPALRPLICSVPHLAGRIIDFGGAACLEPAQIDVFRGTGEEAGGGCSTIAPAVDLGMAIGKG